MGIGSPRLLTLLRCGCATALAALWFAPSALADGALLSTSVGVGPVQATVAVPEPSTSAAPTAEQPTAPALSTTPATATVSNALAVPAPEPAVTDISPAEPEPAQTTVHPASAGAPTPPNAETTSFAEASAPASHSVHRGEPQSPRGRGHKPLPQGAGRPAGADALPSPATRPDTTLRPQPSLASTAATAHNASRIPPFTPQPPAPGQIDFAGPASTTNAAPSVLLLALAATIVFLIFPQFARIVTPCVACARAYPYLLRLERPD